VYVNQLGMAPLAALQTATVNAADLMAGARGRQPGSGEWADIIAVDKNHLTTAGAADVKFVMKGAGCLQGRGARNRE